MINEPTIPLFFSSGIKWECYKVIADFHGVKHGEVISYAHYKVLFNDHCEYGFYLIALYSFLGVYSKYKK